LVFLPLPHLQARTTLRRIFSSDKEGKKANESTSSLVGSKNWVLRVGKSIVFDSKMGMRKFRSGALPFSKVICMVNYSVGILPA